LWTTEYKEEMRPQGAELSCIQLSLNTKIVKELSNFGCGAATTGLKNTL
jgi:hypothetical protein